MGPHLGNNLLNLGITDQMREAVKELGLDLDDLLAAGGRTGAGKRRPRQACRMLHGLSCIVERAGRSGTASGMSSASLTRRSATDGRSKRPTSGSALATLGRSAAEISYYVNFGGYTEQYRDEKGRFRVRWVPHRVVKGIAYDTAVPAYRDDMVDLLRLWKSEAVESFDFQAFNIGDYYKAVEAKVISETVSKVLYPNDEPEIGKTLRLAQQYFFVSCSLQDMIRIHLIAGAAH